MDQEGGPTVLDLEEGSEWRFELEDDENIAVRVSAVLILNRSGDPERKAFRDGVRSRNPVFINSEEIPHDTWYPLYRNLKSSVYAPSPAQLEVSTLPNSQYSSSSTTQPQLTSIHLALERTRLLARRHLKGVGNEEGIERGPRIMVVGPPSSGKTSVVKALTNMALGTGIGWTPTVIGLDPASPLSLIPGSLSLSTPQFPIPTHHSSNSLGSPPTTDSLATMASDVPTLGWWYGHLEPSTKGVDVWRKLVSTMAQKVAERCARDPTVAASGVIMDTSSAFANPTLGTKKDDPKARYTLIAQAIQEFQIDTILVLSHEKLSIDLHRYFPEQNVLRLPKSGGVVDLDEHYRALIQAFQIRSYFYGEPRLPPSLSSLGGRMVGLAGQLTPYSFQIGWETLTIVRVGEENAAPSSALPLGSSRSLSSTRLSRVDPAGPAHVHRLMNAVLAIVHIVPGDKIIKEKTEKEKVESKPEVKEEVKEEPAADGEVKMEDTQAEGAEAEGGEDGVDDDEDEVPYIEEVGTREVAGFIVITGIDAQRRKYTVLSPSTGRLPSTVALAGSIEWVDSE